MATVANPTEQRIVLRDVAWETYERLLADNANSSAPRLTYDRGELEILSPSTEHEEDNRTLALLVELVAMEWSIDVRNVGSMTYKREELHRGFEPDSSFYIQQEVTVRGRAQIDLDVDPPPDLVIEIEVTRPAIAKLPIFASMGVPEVWRLRSGQLTILGLGGGEYEERPGSAALSPLTSVLLTRFLRDSRSLPRTAWVRGVREWARSQAASS